MNEEIGIVAGEIWSYLEKREFVSIYQLRQQLNTQERLLHLALGWLAREEKLTWKRQGRGLYVKLNKQES